MSPTNQKLIEGYIAFYKHSKQSQDNRRSSLRYFFEKTHFGYSGHIFEITTKLLKDYFIWLKNLENLSINTKKNKWTILASFLNYTMEDYPKDFLIKIPSKTINWLGSNGNHKIIKQDLTNEELEKILNYFAESNLKHYLIFRLLAESGMRKGELISIKYPDVNLEKRYLISNGKRDEVVYYFSIGFKIFLENYLNSRKNLKIDVKNLFITNRKTKYSNRAFNLLLKKACVVLGIEKNITCHTFRSTINGKRYDMGCPSETRKVLLNHKTGDVNMESYIKKEYKRFIVLFDQYNPYKELNI